MPNREIQAGRFPEPNLSVRIAYMDHHGIPQVMTVQTTCKDPVPIAAAELRLALDNAFSRLGWEIGSTQLLLQCYEEMDFAAAARPAFTVIKGSKAA